MAIMEFHEADDDHAPFPHRILVLPEKTVKTRFHRTIHYPEQTFVICAECDHWLIRWVSKSNCQCSQNCHSLGRMLKELAETEARQNRATTGRL